MKCLLIVLCLVFLLAALLVACTTPPTPTGYPTPSSTITPSPTMSTTPVSTPAPTFTATGTSTPTRTPDQRLPVTVSTCIGETYCESPITSTITFWAGSLGHDLTTNLNGQGTILLASGTYTLQVLSVPPGVLPWSDNPTMISVTRPITLPFYFHYWPESPTPTPGVEQRLATLEQNVAELGVRIRQIWDVMQMAGRIPTVVVTRTP